MDAMNSHIHSRRTANGISMFRGAVMAGLLISTLLPALPSTTFAQGRDRNEGRHSLVQQPYNARNPFVAQQATVQATIDALTTKVNQLIVDNTSLKDALAAAQGRIDTMQGMVNTMKVSVEALDKKAADIIPNLGTYVKIDTNLINGAKGPHILFTGANVHVRSGSGATGNYAVPYEGLGNLIIGYNENTPTPTLIRTGSHNLVGGSMNSFSSFGGMVFGLQNTISGEYASVLGGNENKAVGLHSTVYGGLNKTAVNMNSYAPLQGGGPAPGGQ